jgi:hypothetical protein
MGWEIVPPVTNVPFKEWLWRGYTDFSKFPRWVWLFEVRLGECVEFTRLRFRDGFEASYCSDAYIGVTEDNNQHVVIARRKTRAEVRKDAGGRRRVEYMHEFRLLGLVPRFMGFLKDLEGYILLLIEDGEIVGAWKTPVMPTPTRVVKIINNSSSGFVMGGKVVANILSSAIPKVGVMELDRSVRHEIVNQLVERGINVVLVEHDTHHRPINNDNITIPH